MPAQSCGPMIHSQPHSPCRSTFNPGRGMANMLELTQRNHLADCGVTRDISRNRVRCAVLLLGQVHHSAEVLENDQDVTPQEGWKQQSPHEALGEQLEEEKGFAGSDGPGGSAATEKGWTGTDCRTERIGWSPWTRKGRCTGSCWCGPRRTGHRVTTRRWRDRTGHCLNNVAGSWRNELSHCLTSHAHNADMVCGGEHNSWRRADMLTTIPIVLHPCTTSGTPDR